MKTSESQSLSGIFRGIGMEYWVKMGQLQITESHKPSQNPVPHLNTRLSPKKNQRKHSVRKRAAIFPMDF